MSETSLLLSPWRPYPAARHAWVGSRRRWTARSLVGLPAIGTGRRQEPRPDAAGGASRWDRSSRPNLLLLAVAFAASRAAFAALGIRFDISALSGKVATDQWQLLDVSLLRHDLLQSIWYLHGQPPLYNLFCGLVLHLPQALEQPVCTACFCLLGLALVLACYLLLVELSVPPWAAMLVCLLLVASPEYVLYENWLFYAYPTAAVLVMTTLCFVRYLRTGRRAWGFPFFAGASAVVLLNSTFQMVWLVAVGALALVVLRRRWRGVLAVALVPVLLVTVWYVKNATMFGTLTTSSWLGMNLARPTLVRAPRAQLLGLVRSGRLSPLAEVLPFSAVASYVPRFEDVRRTGVPVLDEATKADGATNFDAAVFVPIADAYLHDDLVYVETEPGTYLRDTTVSARIWLVAPDQYSALAPNRERIAAYADAFDRAVAWQPTDDPTVSFTAMLTGAPPAPSQLSFAALATLGLTAGVVPLVAWRRRKGDPAAAATLLFLWCTVGYGVAVTTFVEVGENSRFQFELGPLPIVGAAVVLTSLCRTLAGRRRHRAPVATAGIAG